MVSAIKTCHKRRFSDEFQVAKWLKRMQQRHGDGSRIPVRYYYHPDCKGYHVTSQPQREEAKLTCQRNTPTMLPMSGSGTAMTS